MPRFEPVPESREAADELDPGLDDDLQDQLGGDWLEALLRLAERAHELVPDLVGVSVARLEEDLTFTVVSTDLDVATMDAVQYVGGGPCVDGAHADAALEYDEGDVLDEERWRLFAEANAAHGIRSTLTLPVRGHGDQVVGTVNLYAGSSHAFRGHHEQLAEVFGGWAARAVTNADLSFRTLQEARRAPQRVRDQVVVETALGILVVELEVDVEAARHRLETAARQAGVSVARLAREIVRARRRQDGDRPC